MTLMISYYKQIIRLMNTQEVGLENFALLSVIGKGSYAKVLLVRKKGEDGRLYALKILKKKYIEKKKYVVRESCPSPLGENELIDEVGDPFEPLSAT